MLQNGKSFKIMLTKNKPRIMPASIVDKDAYNKIAQKHFKWENEITINPNKKGRYAFQMKFSKMLKVFWQIIRNQILKY